MTKKGPPTFTFKVYINSSNVFSIKEQSCSNASVAKKVIDIINDESINTGMIMEMNYDEWRNFTISG